MSSDFSTYFQLYGKIIALESLQVNSTKNKLDSATVKAESESIVNSLRDELLSLKDDFKIVMSIRKGKVSIGCKFVVII